MTRLDRVAFAKKFNHKPSFMQLSNIVQLTLSIIKDEILGRKLAFWEKKFSVVPGSVRKP